MRIYHTLFNEYETKKSWLLFSLFSADLLPRKAGAVHDSVRSTQSAGHFPRELCQSSWRETGTDAHRERNNHGSVSTDSVRKDVLCIITTLPYSTIWFSTTESDTTFKWTCVSIFISKTVSPGTLKIFITLYDTTGRYRTNFFISETVVLKINCSGNFLKFWK